MDLPLPDLRSLRGREIYFFYGLAGLLLVLLVVIFRAVAKPTPQAGAKRLRGTSNVLFVGPMGSGKTSFFGRLVYKSPPATHTSLSSNSAILPGKNVQIIDLPGHPRLRAHLLAQYLAAADGVVFFIDPTTNATAQGIQATAEHLHVLLCMISILESKGAKRLPPVLLLLTKSDIWSAAQKQRAQERVKSMLERELEKRRKSSVAPSGGSSSRLESIDELPSGSGSSAFNLFSWFSRTNSGSKSQSQLSSSGIVLPEDEQEILQTDALDFDGPFSWDEEKIGARITWATSSSKATSTSGKSLSDEKEDPDTVASNGTSQFWNWLDEYVL